MEGGGEKRREKKEEKGKEKEGEKKMGRRRNYETLSLPVRQSCLFPCRASVSASGG